MSPVTLQQLLTATGGQAIGFEGRDVGFSRVELDSRAVRSGELFWAVKGERLDGHDFTTDALRRGAAACVVQREHAGEVAGPKIVVRNTLDALGDFARWYRQRKSALMIGVTGSVGKTTTREMIHAVLSARFAGTRSPRNFNNQFGLPLSILEIEEHHRFAVLELGASRVGEIRGLARVAVPEVGVVTAVGLAHIEKFGGEQQIIEAKGELVEALPACGLAILAGDDPRVRGMAQRARCRVLFVGEGPDNDVRATDIDVQRDRTAFRVDGRLYEVYATGRQHVQAALCAMAVARESGIDAELIAEGLRTFVPVAGRCRPEQIGSWTVIDDTYNASPSSMQAACEVLRTWTGATRKLLITGDMLELGPRTVECHRELGRTAAAAGIDGLLALGDQAVHVVHGAREAGMDADRLAGCESLEALLPVLDRWLEPRAVLLVKGSRGLRMERVIEWLRRRSEGTLEGHTSRASSRACA